MIALKILPIVQLILILFTHWIQGYSSNYYNSQRYKYDPYENYYYSRNQRFPASYGLYPQLYPAASTDDYYYNSDYSYPIYYYLTPRTAKYDNYYQQQLPYYYQELPTSRTQKFYNHPDPNNNYENNPEKLLQDYEREQREKSQPIGHEIRYPEEEEDDSSSSYYDETTSAAFLNNLMLQQMYQENAAKEKTQSSEAILKNHQEPSSLSSIYADYEDMNKWNDVPYGKTVKIDDEPVKELKELLPKNKQRNNNNKNKKLRRQRNKPKIEVPDKRNDDNNNSVYSDRKPIIKEPSTIMDTDEELASRKVRGQKEEMMMRPATPVRHPFSDSLMEMLSQQHDAEDPSKRSTDGSSVYDKIREILEMQKNTEQNNNKIQNEEEEEHAEEIRPFMKKRIVSSEDSLIKQLSKLKKSQ